MSRPGLALRLFGCLALIGSTPLCAQPADRLMSTDGVRDGQTLLCRHELLSNGTPENQEYALACRRTGPTDHEFGLHCFLDTPTESDRLPTFVCPVTPPLPFVAGKGLFFACESTPTELQAQLRRSLVAQGRSLSTPIPTLKCAAEEFDISWEDVYGKD